MSILRYGIIDIINSFRKYDLIRMLGRQYMVLRYQAWTILDNDKYGNTNFNLRSYFWAAF